MSRTYTDAEMQIASQMAYWDIPAGMTLRDYINTHSGDSDVQKVVNIINDNNLDGGNYSCLDWSVKAVGNDQSRSGMYGCMIDDGYGGALFSFRGSEAGSQLAKDWLAGDFGMLNNTDTWQQEMGREFVRRMYEQYGDEYDGFAFTGHSLGGNLAIDAAINSPAGMRDKITSVVGLDSPGFPQEYWDKYRQQIDEMKGRIKHYQWSIVGSIFETPCGVERTVNTKGWYPDIPGVADQHSILNMDTTNGNVSDRSGGRTDFENNINKISNHADEPGMDFIAAGIAAGAAYAAHKTEEKLRKDAERRGDNDMQISVASDSDSETELEANYSAMMSMENLFRNAETMLNNTSSEMESIAGTIKYHSVVGSLLKMRMRYLSNRYENDYHVANALGNVLNSTVQEYKRGDSNVEQKYESLVFAGSSSIGSQVAQAISQNNTSSFGNTNTAYNKNDGYHPFLSRILEEDDMSQDAMVRMNPLNAGINALGNGFNSLSDSFNDFDDWFGSFSEPVRNLFKHNVIDVIGKFGDVKARNCYELLRDLVTGNISYDSLKNFGKISIDTISTFTEKSSFGATVKTMFEIFPTLLDRGDRWNEVTSYYSANQDWGHFIAYEGIGGINEIFHGVGDGFCKMVDSAFHLSDIGDLGEIVFGFDFGKAFNDVGTEISNRSDELSNTVSDIVGDAINNINVKDTAMQIVGNAFFPVGSAVGTAYNWGKKFVGKLF